jgi:hypothetical protein
MASYLASPASASGRIGQQIHLSYAGSDGMAVAYFYLLQRQPRAEHRRNPAKGHFVRSALRCVTGKRSPMPETRNLSSIWYYFVCFCLACYNIQV